MSATIVDAILNLNREERPVETGCKLLDLHSFFSLNLRDSVSKLQTILKNITKFVQFEQYNLNVSFNQIAI